MFVSTQGPEQQQHQHIGPVHFQQHDSAGHTVSYYGNARTRHNVIYELRASSSSSLALPHELVASYVSLSSVHLLCFTVSAILSYTQIPFSQVPYFLFAFTECITWILNQLTGFSVPRES